MSARTQNKRLWLAGGAVLAVLIALIGYFGAINPQLSAALSTRDAADSARLQNVVLEAKNAKLKAQNDKVVSLRASLAASLAELPSDGGLPEFTRQVSAQATANKVSLTSVIVGAATAVGGAAAAVGTTTAETGTTAAATTAATASAAAGLVQIAITLSATGLGSNDLAFLKAIQVTGPRRALVTASQLAPSGGSSATTGIDGQCTLSLTMTIFSAPLTPTAQAALAKLLSGK